MTRLNGMAAGLATALTVLGAGAAGACTLQTVGELDVDASRGAPLVDGEIDGVKVKMLIDTGAFHTIITRSAATALGLVGRRVPNGYVFGVGSGETQMYAANIKSLKIGTLTAADLPPMLVGGDLSGRPDISVLVGADFLSQFDVELDLGDHMIRLFKSEGCAPAQLVYWNKPYSQAALIDHPGPYYTPKIQTEILLDGRHTLAEVDSGASRTFVDASAAAAAGEPPAQRELMGAGAGSGALPTWVDEFASITIGDENIAHARVTVMDFGKDFRTIEEDQDTHVAQRLDTAPQTLIGDDFLRAHRVMVDYKNHVMVFTYNGGPIFATSR